jgi:hypothetical protein
VLSLAQPVSASSAAAIGVSDRLRACFIEGTPSLFECWMRADCLPTADPGSVIDQ